MRSKKIPWVRNRGMATRRGVVRVTALPAWAAVARSMEGVGGGGARVSRYFSDKASGRVLSEEERAAENVYIQVRWRWVAHC